jgi:uncharacterized protein YggU (UPF0235/DUF167 family)
VDGPTTRLRLRIAPGGRAGRVVGRHGEAWKLRVAAPPERGKANEAVVELLAGVLGLPGSRIQIVRGLSSRDKLVAVRGLTEDEVSSRLEAAAAQPAGAR